MIAEGIGERETSPVKAPPGSGARVGGVQARIPWPATTHSRHQRYRNVPTSIGVRLPPKITPLPGRSHDAILLSGTRAHRALHRCIGRSDRWARRQTDLPFRDRGPAGRHGTGCAGSEHGSGLRETRSGRCTLSDPVLARTDISGDLPSPRSPEARDAAGDKKKSISVNPTHPALSSPPSPLIESTTTQHLYPKTNPDLTTLRDARTSHTR